jgi:diguanylate cyclase (GGDEF)-like protein
MIDMDGLKKINDTHGHPAGDAALILVADSIRTCVRKVDTATRYGGDEFVIVLPEADMKEAEMVVRRILKTIKSNDGRGDLSVSVGIIQWAPEHQTIELFIEAVDHAMYDAKRKAGKSRPRN